VPPLSGRLELVRASLLMVSLVAGSLLVQLAGISSLQQRAAQQRLYDRFRNELALGTAPTGALDSERRAVPIGAPVSYLEIPSIGLRQVVVQGTTPSALRDGPGHRRDTPLPGQVGASVLLGRRASYGGPFARIDDLKRGALVRVTTGQGEFDYRVIGVRREGDRVPPLANDASRLVLTTADGRPLLPSGVLRVDADLQGDALAAPATLVSSATLPESEETMGSDSSRLWELALWLQVLVAAAVGFAWAWHRWGRAQAWVVGVPVILLVAIAVSRQAVLVLPNLL
jgi:LPXTG-site transpeptidase (sortase) family protein